MNFDLSAFLLPCVIAAIVLTVIGSELLKKLDKKDRLKGYRIIFPAALSGIASGLLAFGDFYTARQSLFYWAVIFSISVFCYETILKKFRKSAGMSDEKTA